MEDKGEGVGRDTQSPRVMGGRKRKLRTRESKWSSCSRFTEQASWTKYYFLSHVPFCIAKPLQKKLNSTRNANFCFSLIWIWIGYLIFTIWKCINLKKSFLCKSERFNQKCFSSEWVLLTAASSLNTKLCGGWLATSWTTFPSPFALRTD